MFEYEVLPELDREGECEFSSEYESEEFFPALLPLVKMAAPMAIRAIGGLLGKRRRRQREFEFEFETGMQGEYETGLQSEYETGVQGEYEGDPFIGNLLRNLGGSLGLGEGEYEYESEYESAPITEYEMVMENLAYRAATSESEAEAEAFLGALTSMATRLIPSAAKAITSVAPSLIQGVARVGRTLYNRPETRKLIQTLPDVAKGTVRTLANQVAQGKPLSNQTALRALAANTARVMNNPKRVVKSLKKSHRVQHQLQGKTNGKRQRACV